MRSVVLNKSVRCDRCRLPPRWCVCAGLRAVVCPVEIDVLTHHREWYRPSSTSHLIQRVVPAARNHLWRRERKLRIAELQVAGRDVVILHPQGPPLPSDLAPERTQVVLLDGSWREASAMAQELHGQARLASLPIAGQSRYWLRSQADVSRFSTIEALTAFLRALGQEAAGMRWRCNSNCTSTPISGRAGRRSSRIFSCATPRLSRRFPNCSLSCTSRGRSCHSSTRAVAESVPHRPAHRAPPALTPAYSLQFSLTTLFPMKLPRLCLTLALACIAALTTAAAADARVYELRTYTAPAGKLADLQARFRDHTLKLFEKHGMKNVGYWVPAEAKDGKEDKLIYLLEHKSREAAAASWKAFVADSAWKDVAKKTEANGKIVAKIDSVYLTPTAYSPPMDAGNTPGATRVFELRTYVAPEGKLAALDARFRDHTLALFKKHGITNLGYFHPADADKGAANTLIYFLAYPNREAAAASWKKFREDPNWTKALNESQKDGKLTAKSPDSVYLTPTDYSPIK